MQHSRVLALDVRSQSFAFAVLEEPKMLLDFGRKSYQGSGIRDTTTIVQEKIVTLLNFFMPSAIILKDEQGRNGERLLNRKSAIEVIQREAQAQLVELIFLQRKDVHRAFRQSGNSSKYTIAELVVPIFPELAWKLPTKRKNWQPERYNAAIFDAVSLGLAYFSHAEAISLHDSREFPAQPPR